MEPNEQDVMEEIRIDMDDEDSDATPQAKQTSVSKTLEPKQESFKTAKQSTKGRNSESSFPATSNHPLLNNNQQPVERRPSGPTRPHHQREKSRASMGSSSHRQPQSLIGSIYRRSHSGVENGRAVTIRTIPSALVPDRKQVPLTHATEDTGVAEPSEATWRDVGKACCCHTFSEWFRIGAFLSILLFLLYFFLFGLDLLGTAFKVVGGCTAGALLGSDTNPLAGLMIGIIATALLQSSSTTTAIIVSLVSGGLDVEQAIYMVMGANVGTSVTPLLVSLAHIGDGEELERAFGCSSVMLFFNLYTVIILFPLEVTTNYLYYLTKAMLPATVGGGDSWEGPVKKIVSPLVKRVIIANKALIDHISTGEVESCADVYPVYCLDGIESYDTCNVTGVIACNEKNGECPLFFQNGASKNDDMVSGWVCLVISLTILILCLIGLVALLRRMLLGASKQIIYKATSINPYLAILVGCGVTILVQSSSITTSALVPLAGVGVLDLESIFPLILGADIGTTFTALMAASVSSNVEALQVALVHMFFNVTGVIIWYPIPFMRKPILRSASLVGKITRFWRGFPILFIVCVFYLLPLILLGISSCFEQHKTGFTALGIFLLLLIFGAVAYFFLWWHYRDGRSKCQSYIERRQRRAAAIEALADDMDYLKVDTEWCRNEIGRIKDFASSLRTQIQMEEGRPLVHVDIPPEEEFEAAPPNFGQDDDFLSEFESCRSKPWKNILVVASGSIRSGL